MTVSRRGWLAALVLATAVSLPAVAFAEPSAADKETARSLMSKGRDQTDKNDLKGALESFSAADAIMHVPSTGFAVAKTQAQLGLLVEARETALQVSRIPPAPNEPAPFVEARAKAQSLSDELATRIPALQIMLKSVPAGATPTVTVDGAALPAAALSLPRKLNPGHHVVVARAASSEGKTEVDVKEHETRIIDVELVAGAMATAPAGTGNGTVTPPPIEPDHRSKIPVLAYAGFGVGLAGVVVGSITGIISMSKTSSLKDQCPNGKCPPSVYDSSSFQSDLSSAKTMGTVSTISFIVGGVGIGVGVVALFLPSSASASASTAANKSAKMERQSPRVSPFVGVGSAGLVGTF
ncbi:MAG: hypothetical protein JWM74_6082 [Myxococcaceae bacterium]|nr:hypothetical protein [Myxococcaceae bacterium]